MVATLVAYEFMVFGRPQTQRREIRGLSGDSPLLGNTEEIITPPEEPSIGIPSLADLSPKDPYFVAMNQGSISKPNPETSVADTEATFEESMIADDLQQTFLSIKDQSCQYGVYELSDDTRRFLFKECGKSAYWKDLRDSIIRSAPGFVLSPLGNGGILSIRNLYNEESNENALAITTNEDAWLDALKPVFGNVIALGQVFDPISLSTLMNRFYAPMLPSPSWWFFPGP